MVKTNESAPEAECAAYRPRVYKMLMVRMYAMAGILTKPANVRIYKKTMQKCMVASKRRQCG